MTEDQILEKILIKLYEADAGGVYVSSFISRTFSLELSSGVKYVDKLEALGLAREGETRTRMFITDQGRQVVKNGGLLKYLTDLENEKIKFEYKESLETELTISNIEANRLNKRNSKYNIWFSIINIIIALLNLWLILRSVK